MKLRSSAIAVAICALAGAAPAAAADPPLTVPKAKLDAALHCHGKLHDAKRQPIMLVTGTGATGDEAYAIGKGAFDATATRCARSSSPPSPPPTSRSPCSTSSTASGSWGAAPVSRSRSSTRYLVIAGGLSSGAVGRLETLEDGGEMDGWRRRG